MRILRAGGQYAETREGKLWLAIALILMIWFFVAVVTQSLIVALAVAGAAFLTTKPFRRRLASVRTGRLGEQLVKDLLGRLSDEYYLINDVILPSIRGNVDHVLVGPCGVVVIETKRIAGEITCYGDYWYVKGRRRRSISRQVNNGALAVKDFLQRHHPDLARSVMGFVEAVVVFTHPLCRLTVKGARATVVRYSELLQLVLDLAKKHQMPPPVVERLAKSLVDGVDMGREKAAS